MVKYRPPTPGLGYPGFKGLATTPCIRHGCGAHVRRVDRMSICKTQRNRLGFELGNAILAQIMGDGTRWVGEGGA